MNQIELVHRAVWRDVLSDGDTSSLNNPNLYGKVSRFIKGGSLPRDFLLLGRDASRLLLGSGGTDGFILGSDAGRFLSFGGDRRDFLLNRGDWHRFLLLGIFKLVRGRGGVNQIELVHRAGWRNVLSNGDTGSLNNPNLHGKVSRFIKGGSLPRDFLLLGRDASRLLLGSGGTDGFILGSDAGRFLSFGGDRRDFLLKRGDWRRFLLLGNYESGFLIDNFASAFLLRLLLRRSDASSFLFRCGG